MKRFSFFSLIELSLLFGFGFPSFIRAQPFESLSLTAATQPPKKLQSDHELTRSLVEQTQAQLGDLELLADEYENFQELEERFAADGDNRELAQALIVCSKRVQEVLQRRHLRELFSTEWIKQIDFFANLDPSERPSS